MTFPKRPALAVDRPADMSNFTLRDLMNLKPRIMDREWVDRKLAEGEDEPTLQILPYIVLLDTSEMDYAANIQPKFFVYERGEGGGEGRLFGKVSVGIGGHMEEEPLEDEEFTPLEFAKLIALGAVLEIVEEVGVELPFTDFVNAIFPGTYMPTTPAESILAMDKAIMMYAPITQVDKVHLAVSFVVKMKPADIVKLEEGIITKGRWMTHDELVEAANLPENPIVIETWSQVMIDHVHQAWKRGPASAVIEGSPQERSSVINPDTFTNMIKSIGI